MRNIYPQHKSKNKIRIMVIDFEKEKEEEIKGFKGGKGTFLKRATKFGNVNIMRNILPAGCSIGMHTHDENYEIMYVIKGEITYIYDGIEEIAKAGEVHYCPCGHTHCAENRTNKEAEFLAVVAETK